MRAFIVGLIVASGLSAAAVAQDNSGWRKDYRENQANQRANDAARRESARTEAILGRMGPNPSTPSTGGGIGGATGPGCSIELSCPAGQYFAVYPRCRCVAARVGVMPSCPAGFHWSLRKRCEPVDQCLDDKNFRRLQNGDCIPRLASFRCASGRMIDYPAGTCNNAPWRWVAPSYLPKAARERFLAEARSKAVKAGKYDSLGGYRGSATLLPPYAEPPGAQAPRAAARAPVQARAEPPRNSLAARSNTAARPGFSLDVEPRAPGTGARR